MLHRLYLTYVHAVHKFAQLRPGAEVVVYNSHRVAATQVLYGHVL